jgi:hypothetical protein
MALYRYSSNPRALSLNQLSMKGHLGYAAELKIFQLLRLGTAMCFIGHGAFGIITKPVWCNYFAVFGIGRDLAYQLMPILGCLDILLGIIMLIFPMRVIAAWLVCWGIVTALLRPLSGEPFAEFIERAGNFGAPLVLLMLAGFDRRNWKSWFICSFSFIGRTRVVKPDS